MFEVFLPPEYPQVRLAIPLSRNRAGPYVLMAASLLKVLLGMTCLQLSQCTRLSARLVAEHHKKRCPRVVASRKRWQPGHRCVQYATILSAVFLDW